MAVKTSWFSLDPDLGINFNQTYAGVNSVAASVTSTGNIDQGSLVVASDSLGTTRQGTDGSQWILVKASTTITQFNLIVFDDSYNANNFATALALTGFNLAVAQFGTYLGQSVVSVDPSTNPVFWAAVRGTGMQIAISGSAGTGAILSNGVSPGCVTVSTTTGTQLAGIQILVSQTTGAAAIIPVECNINFPKLRNFW